MIDSLAIIDKVLVIAQVCQRERRGSEEDRQTDGRTDGRIGADAGWLRRDVTSKRNRQRNGRKGGNKTGGGGEDKEE